jgi:hypothetical protein
VKTNIYSTMSTLPRAPWWHLRYSWPFLLGTILLAALIVPVVAGALELQRESEIGGEK